MIYREIHDNEAIKYAELDTTSFFLQTTESRERISNNRYNTDEIRGVFNNDEKMVAGARLIEFQMNIDSSYIKCGGIGSVASYPEHRKEGNISFLFNNLLNEMYNSDYVISYLYPFSHPFYRKYEYDTSHDFIYHNIPTAQLSKYDSKAIVMQHIPDTMDDKLEDIISIYEKYAPKYNLMISRDYTCWKSLFSDDAYNSEYKTYIYYSAINTPASYVKYKYKKLSASDIELTVVDIAFVDSKSLLSILGFLSRLLPYVEYIKVNIPADVKILDIIDEPHDVSVSYEAGGMARIVNVQKALTAMNKASLRHNITIKVIDSYIHENNHTFTIYADKSDVDITDDKNADIKCSVQSLAQLVVGYRNIDNLLFLGKIAVNNNIDTLKHFFTSRITHIQDRF